MKIHDFQSVTKVRRHYLEEVALKSSEDTKKRTTWKVEEGEETNTGSRDTGVSPRGKTRTGRRYTHDAGDD